MEQHNQEIIELQNENKKLKKECKKMDKMNGEIAEMKDKNTKLEKEIHELKEKLAKIEAYMKKKKFSIPHRKMPAELFNELFASMPLENAFGLLAKMPNGLLVRNVQKIIKSTKEVMKTNKLNKEDYRSNLTFSDDGLFVKYSGPHGLGYNCVRAVLPIPLFNLKAITKSIIASYFEMEILNGVSSIFIGFCDQQFPLEGKWLGSKNSNSIGFNGKYGIWIDGELKKFDNTLRWFTKGNFVGLGIIYHPNSKMECFATWNGELLRKKELSPKFVNLQLFPAFNLGNVFDSIHLNFGKKEWQFKEFRRVLN